MNETCVLQIPYMKSFLVKDTNGRTLLKYNFTDGS